MATKKSNTPRRAPIATYGFGKVSTGWPEKGISKGDVIIIKEGPVKIGGLVLLRRKSDNELYLFQLESRNLHGNVKVLDRRGETTTFRRGTYELIGRPINVFDTSEYFMGGAR